MILQKRIRSGSQLQDFQQTNEYTELFGMDGEPTEFEWNLFPGFTSFEILEKIRKDLEVQQKNPEQFGGRIIFMMMFKFNFQGNM